MHYRKYNVMNICYLCIFRREVYHIQRELLRERTRCKALEEELENPMNIHRWRKLEVCQTVLQTHNLIVTVFDLITAPVFITPPPLIFSLFSLIAHLTIFFPTFYFIFTYYRPLDDLFGTIVVENKFT